MNRYMDPPKPVYDRLLKLVKDKDYFVITTNVDHCFQTAGFDKERLFYTQGDYGLWQCSGPCHNKTYDNAEAVRAMVEAQGFVIAPDGTLTMPEGVALKQEIPGELIPRCPVCHKPLRMNLRSDDAFVEDEGWHRAAQRYESFLRAHEGRLLFLELGVGDNTPGIIKYPFWRMTARNPEAIYACLNYGEATAPEAIAERAICLNGDIGEILDRICNEEFKRECTISRSYGRRNTDMKMKAGIYNGVGSVSVTDVDKPTLRPGMIIIRNIRSGICGTDLHAYNIDGPEVGILPGNQFGHEMSGVVDEVGEGVTAFKKGQRVFVNPVTFREPSENLSVLQSCDMAGAFSEYVMVEHPVEGYNVFTLEESLDWDVAAMIEPISVALNGILMCQPKKGDKVVIYGGGIIGLCALACLKCLEIDDVIVTARNPFRSAKIEEMGGILCNTKETGVPEFVMKTWGKSSGNNGEDTWNADFVLDCAGYPGAFGEIMQYARVNSHIGIIALGTGEEKLVENWLCFKACSIHGSFAYTPEVNRQVIEMITAYQEVFRPIATATYGLSELPEAFQAANNSKQQVKVLIDHSK